MTYLMRGALMEYGDDFLAPIPNVVIFQFNPETLTRTIQIPERPTGADSREESQAGDVPLEKVSLTAYFSAADKLGDNDVLARGFGIGPQLAALEKMVFPAGRLSGLLGEAIDAIGDAIFGGDDNPTQPTPREQYPKILFIWGPTRVQPVIIESMKIVEKQYDNLLNPVLAEVVLRLAIMHVDPSSTDLIAKGASEYTSLAKETLAASNLVNTVGQISDIIPF